MDNCLVPLATSGATWCATRKTAQGANQLSLTPRAGQNRVWDQRGPRNSIDQGDAANIETGQDKGAVTRASSPSRSWPLSLTHDAVKPTDRIQHQMKYLSTPRPGARIERGRPGS
jgi:hypothetical protein